MVLSIKCCVFQNIQEIKGCKEMPQWLKPLSRKHDNLSLGLWSKLGRCGACNPILIRQRQDPWDKPAS